jgi:hypothetical protein
MQCEEVRRTNAYGCNFDAGLFATRHWDANEVVTAGCGVLAELTNRDAEAMDQGGFRCYQAIH